MLPTHRRRGLARELMHELVRDASRRRLALMSLRASEAPIYERFGFGLGGEICSVTIDPQRMSPMRGADRAGTFRLLDGTEFPEVVPGLYERVALRRPGAITRPSSWDRRLFGDAIDGTKARFVVVHTDEHGADDGFVHYETSWDEHGDWADLGRGEVFDAFGATAAVELALWQYICDVDLVRRWTAQVRPVDDLIRLAADDPRGYRVRAIDDEQWVRLVDVDAALTGRVYNPTAGAVTIEVSDPLVPTNGGMWRITADGAVRAMARPTSSPASSAYLPHISRRDVVVGARAAALADALFASKPLPFCGTFF